MSNSAAKSIFSRLAFLLILGVCAVASYFYFEKEKPALPFLNEEPEEDEVTSLELGKRYRIFVRSIIVPPTDYKGSKWDVSGKSGAPDIFFRVFYLDHLIYESSTIDDVLVAEFSAVKGGITDAILSKNVSEYLEAANVAYIDQDSRFQIEVIDSDTFDNDTIGKKEIYLRELKLGSNSIQCHGVTYVLSVIDADTDINESLKALKIIK